MLRLREIELQGFKSFAERTKMPLPGDILVVVGPNGAGKSNVTDAVLWALGEQSPKSLRGKKMVDVIFNGTQKRPAAGSAQVLMTFEDTDGTKYQVGRRLLRSGESTYLMDGRPVRLKDMHEFLMRYAISTQGSYLVEQGEVSALLEANPEERRMIFEEVAGIAHFKENRRSALSKLDSTTGNLTRLNDIVSEVESQMGTLKRQASKADRFVRLSDELRERRRSFWGRSFGKFTGQRSALARDLALFQEERQRRETALSRLQSELEQATLQLSEHETSLASLIQSIHDKELDHERGEQEIKRRTDQVASSQGRLRQIVADREDLRRRMEAGRADRERLEAEATALAASETAARATSEGSLKALEEARARVEALEGAQRELRQRAFAQAQEQARASSEVKRQEEELRRLGEREKRLQREGESLAAREQSLQESLEGKSAERSSADEALLQARTAREDAERRSERSQAALEAATTALAEGRQRSAAAQSRLEVLIQHEATLRSSAHAFLKKRYPERVQRTLAEALSGVPDGLVPALSAALGDLLEGYLKGRWDDVTPALTALRAGRAGEAVFFLDAALRENGPLPTLQGRPEFQGWLHEAEGIPADLKGLLPLVALSPHPEAARALAMEGVAAVSLDGIFAHPKGWMRGGAGGKGGASLLEHQRERRAAERDLEAAHSATAEAQAALEKVRGEREASRQALELARAAETEAAKVAASLARDVEALESEGRRLESARELFETEAAQAREERSTWEPQLAEMVRLLEKASAEAARVDLQIKAGETAADAAKAAQNTAHEAVADTRSAWSEVNQRLQACRDTLERSGKALEDLAATDARIAREGEGLTARVAALTAEITEGDRSLRGLLLALEELRQRKVTFEQELENLKAGVEASQRHVKDAREALEVAREEVARTEVALAGVEADLRNLSERMGEVFEEDPEALAQAFSGEPPLSDEERQAEHKALARLEERIAELGAVNMLARDEYGELEKRFEFLTGQRKDLEEAVANLQDTIRKINRTTKERFMEAFEAVRIHFAHLFKEVFEGGEARLGLLDEQNPLDTGVEIFAQPPGKKLQHMDQLSGGEKAMVAIALLFSLFRYRPQPFFILDEVDAPLDEASVHRFNRLLEQFRGQTQFIVVTHNKKTMEMAEVLYGVTMPEGGISRIVSVRLAEVEEKLGVGKG